MRSVRCITHATLAVALFAPALLTRQRVYHATNPLRFTVFVPDSVTVLAVQR